MRWPRRRVLVGALALAFVPLGAACNLIIGAHERFLVARNAVVEGNYRASLSLLRNCRR